MLSGSAFTVLLLVALFSLACVADQIIPPSTAATQVIVSSAGASGQSSTATSAPAPSSEAPAPTSTTVGQTVTPSQSQPAQPTQTVAALSASSVKPSTSASAAAPTTEQPTVKPTCAALSFTIRAAWEEDLANTSSKTYNLLVFAMHFIMKDLYNASQINVTELKSTKSQDGLVSTKFNLCLIVKTSDGVYIEDVFRARIKTGRLSGNLLVKSDSAGFEAIGVKFKDWKAKDGECERICDGAGGEFMIEATCEAKTNSCNGLKNTKMAKDCLTYCPSSAVAYTVSFFILAIGIFFSLSFQ